VEGLRHGLLDFHALTKEFLTYKCQSPRVLKTGLEGEGLTGRRRLIDGHGFEKMGVAR
jgi:hypothetical protein